jgi:GT2 family glycosyltransferase
MAKRVEAETSEHGLSLEARVAIAEAELERLHERANAQEWLAAALTEKQKEVWRAEAELRDVERLPIVRQVVRARAAYARVRRISERIRRLLRLELSTGTAGRVSTDLLSPSEIVPEDARYQMWVECYDTIDDSIRRSLKERLGAIEAPPLVSIILPVFDVPEKYLREALNSILCQIYPYWELCIADDCSTAPWISAVLDEYAARDGRIKVERRLQNGHISAASNTALSLATGEWIACFDHDDVLAEHALAVAVLAICHSPGAGILYSDEDHLDDLGSRDHPYFKPDFDPLLINGQNYFSHLCMIRRDLVDAVGGYRQGFEGSQDWDLVLRVLELLEPEQVVHVPHVLYHWRVHPDSTASSLSAKPYAAVAARRAVQEHLDRSQVAAKVQTIGGTSFNRVHWELPQDPPSVSIIIIARNGHRMIRCIESVRLRSIYPTYEVIVVDDGGAHPPLRQYLDRVDHWFTVRRDERKVSDAALYNGAAGVAKGEALCFLDDEVEVLSERWLEEMLGVLMQPTIGAVGAKLLYPDGSIEHAGLVAGIHGSIGRPHHHFDRLEPGYFGRAMLVQCFSAVSSACMVVRREAFEAIGGFDETNLSAAFHDVDLCFRLAENGWRVAWTPFAEMIHYQAPDRPAENAAANEERLARELRYLRSRWGKLLELDPAYNGNLSLAHETLPLAWPPRVSYR